MCPKIFSLSFSLTDFVLNIWMMATYTGCLRHKHTDPRQKKSSEILSVSKESVTMELQVLSEKESGESQHALTTAFD